MIDTSEYNKFKQQVAVIYSIGHWGCRGTSPTDQSCCYKHSTCLILFPPSKNLCHFVSRHNPELDVWALPPTAALNLVLSARYQFRFSCSILCKWSCAGHSVSTFPFPESQTLTLLCLLQQYNHQLIHAKKLQEAALKAVSHHSLVLSGSILAQQQKLQQQSSDRVLSCLAIVSI